MSLIQSKEFHQHTFKKGVPSTLAKAHLVECKFVGCNLSLMKWEGARLQEVEFDGCKLVGVNFSKIDPLFFKVKFKNCLLDLTNFSGLDLRKTTFSKCQIREAHFCDSNLIESDFSGSDLAGTTFHNCNLSKSNFTIAVNYSINPATNILKKAQFSSPEVHSLLKYFDIIID